jgi:MoxR-like ATPase
MENNFQNQIQTLIAQIEQVIKGKTEAIEKVLTCLFAGGHILLEDNPGTGKTVLAKTLAASIGGGHQSAIFKRIQFTPDLLPMDLIGSHIYDDVKKDFIFKKGPLFCNVLLADEINRASPKVQSALLECMAENQISLGDTTYPLEKLFFSIATQNPIEMEGTYPLPAAQLDRFYMKISLGYSDYDVEREILNQYAQIAKNAINTASIISLEDIENIKQEIENVFVHPEIINSVAQILQLTRQHSGIALAASTRSGIAFLKCLKAFAYIKKRNYVTEDDVANLIHPVLHHRLEFKDRASKQNTLAEIKEITIKKLSQLKINA